MPVVSCPTAVISESRISSERSLTSADVLRRASDVDRHIMKLGESADRRATRIDARGASSAGLAVHDRQVADPNVADRGHGRLDAVVGDEHRVALAVSGHGEPFGNAERLAQDEDALADRHDAGLVRPLRRDTPRITRERVFCRSHRIGVITAGLGHDHAVATTGDDAVLGYVGRASNACGIPTARVAPGSTGIVHTNTRSDPARSAALRQRSEDA